MAEHGKKVHFLDREHESQRLREAFLSGRSMMISGPADIGKTALLKHVLAGLPGKIGSQFLYLAGFTDLQDLLRKLLARLYRAGNPALLRQLHAEGVSEAHFDDWLKSTTSPRLKGALYRAAEQGNYHLILDLGPPLTGPTAKVVKELFWMRNTPVCLLIRDEGKQKIEHLSHFFHWGSRERLALGPLPKPVAGEMLEQCIVRFQLANFDLDDFREEVLNLSGCVPGAIVKMCALAADGRYQFGKHIKTKLVHIDYLMSGSGLKSRVLRTGRSQVKTKET